MSPTEDGFEIFTSLRYDPILGKSIENGKYSTPGSALYMLRLHRDRMLQAARHFGWKIGSASDSGHLPSKIVDIQEFHREVERAVEEWMACQRPA